MVRLHIRIKFLQDKVVKEKSDLAAKDELRRRMVNWRAAQDPPVAARRSRLALEYLLRDPCWRKARSVGLYMGIRAEIDTGALLAQAFATGKQVYLPRIVDKKARTMQFAACVSIADLSPGVWRILEPLPGPEPERLDLIVLPGLAFDKSGLRLGYGGGYYDSYLGSSCRVELTMGLCYSFQIVERIPADPWDVRVNGLCSEAGLQWL